MHFTFEGSRIYVYEFNLKGMKPNKLKDVERYQFKAWMRENANKIKLFDSSDEHYSTTPFSSSHDSHDRFDYWAWTRGSKKGQVCAISLKATYLYNTKETYYVALSIKEQKKHDSLIIAKKKKDVDNLLSNFHNTIYGKRVLNLLCKEISRSSFPSLINFINHTGVLQNGHRN